jgi:formate transporter
MNETPGDALLPPAMAKRAEDVGVGKVKLRFRSTATLAVLAGAFISFGAIFSTVVSAGAGTSFGVTRILAGLAFSLGLILVVVGGAELFTGNNLIVMAWASRRITTRQLMRNWVIVYVGNFVGAIAMAWFMYWSGQYRSSNGVVGKRMLEIAASKTSLGFGGALILGIFANVLVCLAVWLCMSARSVADKVVAIVFPIAGFVASGFEHSIANMYFIPVGLFVRHGSPASFWSQIGSTSSAYPRLTWARFITHNLVPVTLGNIIGGAVLVGIVYWSVYGTGTGSGSDTTPAPSK